jgi:hypothetical protein
MIPAMICGRRSGGLQVELVAASYCRSPVVDAELGVDVLGMGPDRGERDAQLTGDPGAVEVRSEEP